MDTNAITKFLNELDNLNRRSSGNSKSRIFTDRARTLIVNAYRLDFQTKIYTAREGKDTSTADKLIGMGFEQAIYGRGRDLLQK